MRKFGSMICATIAVAAFGFAPARAAVACTFNGTAESPAVVDQTDDAALGGIDASVTAMDPTDIERMWFQTAPDGAVTTHISVTNIPTVDSNPASTFKIIKTNFVSAQIRPTAPPALGPTFQYGYLDTSTPGVQSLVAQGFTTGSVTPGSPGEIAITVPFNKLGDPQAGQDIDGLLVQARVLIGHPGHGHPEIAPNGASGGGVVSTVDDTTNAADACDTLTL